MIKLTEEQISDIAQDLEAGLKCFIHKVTGEVKTLPDELNGNQTSFVVKFQYLTQGG